MLHYDELSTVMSHYSHVMLHHIVRLVTLCYVSSCHVINVMLFHVASQYVMT